MALNLHNSWKPTDFQKYKQIKNGKKRRTKLQKLYLPAKCKKDKDTECLMLSCQDTHLLLVLKIRKVTRSTVLLFIRTKLKM